MQVSAINHLNGVRLQKTNEIYRQGQSAVSDTAPSLSLPLSLSLSLCEGVSRRTEPERSGRRGGDGGAKQVPEPRDAAALTTTPWCGIRREGGMKGEAPGDQTVTSHKALFTKDTHTPALHLLHRPPLQHLRSPKLDPPKVPGPGPGRQR